MSLSSYRNFVGGEFKDIFKVTISNYKCYTQERGGTGTVCVCVYVGGKGR